MNYPTIKQLRYFIALVEHTHFGRAAQSCFVSQSAFSVAIKELESVLDADLVDRTNKSVTITNIGHATYAQAKLVMRELSNLVEFSQGDKKPLSGKLALGIIPTIAPFLLSKFVFKLQNKHPQLELYLHEGMTLSIYEKLMTGELDVLLIALPYALKSVEFMPLFRDQFSLAYKPNSKWQPNKKTLEPLDESVLLLEDGHCLREHALSACHVKSLDKVSKYSASSMLTLIEMVKTDIGVTYLPEMSLDSHLVNQAGFEIHTLANNSYREIGLVWRKGSSRVTEFKLLGQFIQEHRH